MGKYIVILFVLVLAVAGAGYYNYERNAHLDKELENRPYAAYSDADLQALIDAHEMEAGKIRNRLVGEGGDPTLAMNAIGDSDFKGKVDAFDKSQRRIQRNRKTNRAALSHDVVVEAIEKEQSIRARGLDDEWTRKKRRLLTF